MTGAECFALIDFLNDRLRAFRNPWYTWAIEITWDKLVRWAKMLGYYPPGASFPAKERPCLSQ